MPKERVLDFEVTHRLVDGGAEVDYTVTTNGSHDVTVEVLDGTTKVAEASGKTGTLKITNAKLWNVHAAYLYNFVIRITDGHAVIDEYFDKIGIRTFEVKDGHFLLNGKPVYLRGFGKHEFRHPRPRPGPGYRQARLRADEVDRRKLLPHQPLPLCRRTVPDGRRRGLFDH